MQYSINMSRLYLAGVVAVVVLDKAWHQQQCITAKGEAWHTQVSSDLVHMQEEGAEDACML